MDSDRSAFVDAQVKAQRVYQVFSDSAPPPLQGETSLSYNARLASKYQPFARDPKLKGVKLSEIKDANALDFIVGRIYNDAMAEATHPTRFQPGELRGIATADQSGRQITRYYGDPNACWDQFNPPIRYVRRFITATR